MGLDEVIGSLTIVTVLLDIIGVSCGLGLCFAPIKWRRGLLTTCAIYWGLFLGFLFGAWLAPDIEIFLLCCSLGAIVLPILTYTTATVNRFVLGFLVVMKIAFLFTVPMFKDGSMEVETALAIPLIAGTLFGFGFAAWVNVKMGAFILACAFLGASETAPVIEKYFSRFMFSVTQDISWIFDPIDYIFSLFKIELTSTTTLVIMLILITIGISYQVKSIQNQGFQLSDPVIAFETDDKTRHGKIYRS